MDFDFSDEQKMVQETARRLMEREIIPIADEYDRSKALFDRGKLDPLLKKISPLGYVGGTIPEEWGGAGLDMVTLGILLEELFKAYASLAGIIMLQVGTTRQIFLLGSEEHKKRFLPSLCSGEKIICGAITEPNVGSNNVAIETLAKKDGDSYVINGTKTWISNGSISDVVMIVVQTKKGSGAKGICQILVDRNESPYTAREISKLGLRSFPTSELIFEDCRVPEENLLITPGKGLKTILSVYELGRSMMSIGAVGMGQAAIDASIKYARERIQFGRPIGGFQLIQEMIADMIAEIDASRLLAYRALSLLDKGMRCDTEASLAKLYSTEAAVRVTSKAIQIHGAYGLSEEYPVERFFRDARSWTIPDGTTQIQKLIVGSSVLGIRAFS